MRLSNWALSKMSLDDRFDMKWVPEPNTGCFLWFGYRDPKWGYGIFGIPKANNVKAHRFAYSRKFGPIPDGLVVCHSCDEPACVNPDHLWLGTVADNNKDCITKGRQSIGERHRAKCPRGEMQGSSRLTAEQVIEIRRRCANGESQRSIANSFGIVQQHVSKLWRRTQWSHV